MVRRTPTRIISQDMKTGQFAYQDQLMKDGYFSNLWVLLENYEPQQPVGQSTKLPLVPIFNVSPPNLADMIEVNINNQMILGGSTPSAPFSVTAQGRVITVVT
jgi:hypothetical protein